MAKKSCEGSCEGLSSLEKKPSNPTNPTLPYTALRDPRKKLKLGKKLKRVKTDRRVHIETDSVAHREISSASTSRAISMAVINTTPQKLLKVMVPCMVLNTITEEKKGNIVVNAFMEMGMKIMEEGEVRRTFTLGECRLMGHRLSVLMEEMKHPDGGPILKEALNQLMELGEKETEGDYLILSNECKHSYELFEIASKYSNLEYQTNIKTQEIKLIFSN